MVTPRTSQGRYQNLAEDEALIAILGSVDSKKSSFIDLVSGSKLNISGSLRCRRSYVDTAKPFLLDGRRVTLIDTPDLDNTVTLEEALEVVQDIDAYIKSSYGDQKLHGVLYFHDIRDLFPSPIVTENLQMFLSLCQDRSFRNIVIVTDMWSRISPEDGANRQDGLASDVFQTALKHGAKITRHNETLESAQNTLRFALNNYSCRLAVQAESADELKNISGSGFSAAAGQGLVEQLELHNTEMPQSENVGEALPLAEDKRNIGSISPIDTESCPKYIQQFMQLLQQVQERGFDNQSRVAVEERLNDFLQFAEHANADVKSNAYEVQKLVMMLLQNPGNAHVDASHGHFTEIHGNQTNVTNNITQIIQAVGQHLAAMSEAATDSQSNPIAVCPDQKTSTASQFSWTEEIHRIVDHLTSPRQ